MPDNNNQYRRPDEAKHKAQHDEQRSAHDKSQHDEQQIEQREGYQRDYQRSTFQRGYERNYQRGYPRNYQREEYQQDNQYSDYQDSSSLNVGASRGSSPDGYQSGASRGPQGAGTTRGPQGAGTTRSPQGTGTSRSGYQGGYQSGASRYPQGAGTTRSPQGAGTVRRPQGAEPSRSSIQGGYQSSSARGDYQDTGAPRSYPRSSASRTDVRSTARSGSQVNNRYRDQYEPQRASGRASTSSTTSDMYAVRMLDEATLRSPYSRFKTIGMIAIVVAVLAALIFGGYKLFGLLVDSSEPVEPGLEVTVVVSEGASTSEIARLLRSAGVISDERAFRNAVTARNADTSLKPGQYVLITGMDLDELIALLIEGPPPIEPGTRLTIPEGLTVEKTAALVEEICGIPQEEFLALAYSADTYVPDYDFLALSASEIHGNSLEGFLFPKTYAIPEDATADTVIRILLNQFAIEIASVDMTYANSRNLTFFDVITAASLIERETAAEDERALVSSVIYNRLRAGWKLQIDASVVYALGPSYDGHPLLNVDTEIDSPYNTYIVQQLPAGPICSPQLASIEAAAHPADTDFYYYVLTSKDGTHTFCRNESEFNDAKRIYEQVFGTG